MTYGEFGGPTQENMGVKPPTPETSLPVYRNMKEDPMYQGEGKSFIDFPDDIFGYKMAQVKDGKIAAIGGNDGKVPYLHLNDIVKPKGDSKGFVPGGLDPDQDTEIVEFIEPFKDGRTDAIVRVKQGDKTAWLKPYQMEQVYFPKK